MNPVALVLLVFALVLSLFATFAYGTSSTTPWYSRVNTIALALAFYFAYCLYVVAHGH
jgi:hypothetical protein